MKKPLAESRDEYKDMAGHVLHICVIHELDPRSNMTFQAMTVICGLSVCREHLAIVVDYINRGKSVTNIVKQATLGQFHIELV